MKILKVTREDKCVIIRDELMGHKATEKREIEYHEAPLQAFDQALQNLKEVIQEVMEVPSDWVGGVAVKSLSISYTAKGTRSATIVFSRPMSTGDEHRMKTPTVQIDGPAEGEDGEQELTEAQAILVNAMIHEAERYSGGERQQILLPLESSDTVEPQSGDDLDFSPPTDPVFSGKEEAKN